jgi:hypothetical protein
MIAKNAVRVAVPVKLARLRVWVDKGRHWSGVDRLVLWALSVEPCTAGELAKVARIPSRLITEIVLRMMRFGWIEFAAAPKGAAFRATEAGREVVETFETLPPVTRRTSRRISFAMEPFAWPRIARVPAPCLGQHELLFVAKALFGLQVLRDFKLKRMLLRGVYLASCERIVERLIENVGRRPCGFAIRIDVAAHVSILGRHPAITPDRSPGHPAPPVPASTNYRTAGDSSATPPARCQSRGRYLPISSQASPQRWTRAITSCQSDARDGKLRSVYRDKYGPRTRMAA